MKELLQSENIQIKIKADEKALKCFKELHGLHIQKGPDDLIISAQDCNLNFRTTFEPGPGVSQNIHCIIAGEPVVLLEMDLTSKDWRAFADRLTARNNARIMYEATKKDIEKILHEQRTTSEKTRLEFEKSGDPKIIIDYVKRDFTGETIKEPWVAEVLASWKRDKNNDLISKMFFPKGRAETPYSELLENLIFVDRIDQYRAEQGTLKSAILTEMRRVADGEVDFQEFDRLKSQYERFKKIPTICRAIEGPGHYEMILYATKITLGEQPIGRATMKYKFPKK